MNKFNFFAKQKEELHLTTTKRIKILKIAKIIKKILHKKKINVVINPSSQKDLLQNNMNNVANKFFQKYWKPQYNIEEGIEKIINYYLNGKYN